MRKLACSTVVAFLALTLGACGESTLTTPDAPSSGEQTVGSEAGSLGNITLDTDVSEWNVGSDQPNGQFITAEGQGVEIGLRAQERFEGLLGVTGATAAAGSPSTRRPPAPAPAARATTTAPGTTTSTWTCRTRGAATPGRPSPTTVLVLEQDFTEQSLFESLGSDPVELPMVEGVCVSSTFDPDDLCQQSWNPGFGNSPDREESGEGAAYDPDEERDYHLRLVLTPETFNAQPLAVEIRVEVSD